MMKRGAGSILVMSAMVGDLGAQTGPGGVGNSSNNIMWFAADHGVVAPTLAVSQWSDRSGNGNHAAQADPNARPTLIANALNGYPALLFDNDQANPDYLTVPDNSTLEGMNGLTGFVVFRLNPGTPNSAPRGFFSKRNSPDAQNAYGWFLWQNGSNLGQHLDIVGTGDRLSTSENFSTGVTYTNCFTFHGGPPSNNQDLLLYTQNAQVGNRSESSSSIPNYSSDLHVGVLYGHTGSGANTTRFNGYIAEIIMYNITVSPVQRLIVSNYLSAKYGTSLTSGDLYTMDTPANGNYDHDVAGIGRSSSDVVDDSRGTGIVRMRRSSGNISNNTYLLWGHDNGALGSWGVTDLPSGLQGRMQRVWRVSEVNNTGTAADVGNVDITFDLSGLGPVVAADLRLLVDTDNNGVFANDTPIAGAVDIGGGQYRFNNVNAIAHARRFTLGTVNINTTPLPVELVHFHAEPEDHVVHLRWMTATELDNDRFVVERSAGGSDHADILEIPGAGTSLSPIDYHLIDDRPLPGTSYYRLRQIDFDGTSQWSPVVAVHRSEQADPVIHPLPFTDRLQVRMPSARTMRLSLHDMAGRIVQLHTTHADEMVLPTGDLPAGQYILQVHSDTGEFRRAVMKAAP